MSGNFIKHYSNLFVHSLSGAREKGNRIQNTEFRIQNPEWGDGDHKGITPLAAGVAATRI